MKTRLVVLVLLVLVMASLISPASADWWTGDKPTLGTEAFPVNKLRLTPRYRETFEPLSFTIATKTDRDGNPLDIITAFFEENLTILKGKRPLMATCQAMIMMGDGGLGEMYATYNGAMIKIVVEPDNGWEEGTKWLETAIYDAQVQAGMRTDLHKADPRFRQKYRDTERAEQRAKGEDPRCDSGIFPPFVTAPAESRPKLLPDGTIHFDNPQKSVNVKIVVPISNELDGDGCYVSLFVKHQKGKGKLWEQTSASFITSHMARVTIPNPEIARERSQAAEPPLASERVRSVAPPAAPLVQAGELPSIDYNNTAPPPVAQVPNYYSGMPALVEEWVYGDSHEAFRMTRNQPWDRECLFPAKPFPDNMSQGNLLFFAHRNGRLFDQGAALVWINGELYAPATPYMSLWTDDSRGNIRGAIMFIHCPPGAHVKIEYVMFGLDCIPGAVVATDEFDAGPAGMITYRPRGY